MFVRDIGDGMPAAFSISAKESTPDAIVSASARRISSEVSNARSRNDSLIVGSHGWPLQLAGFLKTLHIPNTHFPAMERLAVKNLTGTLEPRARAWTPTCELRSKGSFMRRQFLMLLIASAVILASWAARAQMAPNPKDVTTLNACLDAVDKKTPTQEGDEAGCLMKIASCCLHGRR